MTFTKLISLDEEAHIIWKEQFGKHSQKFSKWVSDQLKKEFISKDFIVKKEKELKEELKKIKGLKKISVEKKVIADKTSEEETEFLKGAKKRVKENPGEVTENCRVYNMNFEKKVSLEKFKRLLE